LMPPGGYQNMFVLTTLKQGTKSVLQFLGSSIWFQRLPSIEQTYM
jgi:hypothetical protein